MSSRRPRSLFSENNVPNPSFLRISGISVKDLGKILASSQCEQYFLIDCRRYERFANGHIRGAESLETLFDYGFRMVESGCEVSRLRTDFVELHQLKFKKVVFYDDNSTALNECCSYLTPFMEQLSAEKCEIYLLKGGFSAFSAEHPNLCLREDLQCVQHVSERIADTNSLPVSLRSVSSRVISPDKLHGSRVTSMLVLSPDQCGPDFCSFLPSTILPHLFIGSEHDAKDNHFITSHAITHVVNVTSNIPCFFENRLQYKRLPACDTDCENIKQYFKEASDFIAAAEQCGGRVLVHCQAGISRSPSIVLAYLIERRNMAFTEAYQLLSKQRPIIAPNFNFLAQLNEFEMEITLRRSSSSESSSDESTASTPGSCNSLLPLPPKRCRFNGESGSPSKSPFSDIPVTDPCCL